MKELENWTDEELIQVYDLQKSYAEKIVDFVRHGEENDVYKFLNIVPELHSDADFENFEKEIYTKSEYENKYNEKIQERYIYKDLSGNWKDADNLREIFDEKYLWEFAEAQPADLALFANVKEVALEKYSEASYEKLRISARNKRKSS